MAENRLDISRETVDAVELDVQHELLSHFASDRCMSWAEATRDERDDNESKRKADGLLNGTAKRPKQ